MTMLCQRFTTIAMGILCTLAILPAHAEKDTVTNTNNAGLGSLRAAIDSVNTRPGLDTIVFELPTGAPCIITLTAALPTITDALFIDGYSQAGAAAGPIATRTIRININAAAIGTGNALTISADNVTITGLALYSAPGYGIKVLNTGVDNVTICGNYIGTDSTGLATGLGNVSGGVEVNIDASFTLSTNITVGTNGDGVNDANEGNLITSSSSGTGNNGDGVLFWRTGSSRIAGNIIGLNKNGLNSGMGHSRDGIVVTVFCTNIVIGTNGDGVSDNLESNYIAGNAGRGILVGALSSNVAIAGNTIGLNSSGGAAGNGTHGIEILNCSNNRIGTDGIGPGNALESNVISSNGLNGIRLNSASFFGYENSTNNNSIAGNYIGTDASGTLARGNNLHGIVLLSSFAPFTVSNNIIGSNYDGSNDALEANTIANNLGNGIQIDAPGAGAPMTGNKFARNSIHDNALLGVDLGGNGVTANDDGDGDTGANDLLNAPVITSAVIEGTDLVLSGFTRPGTVVEFYIPDAGPNPNPNPYLKSFGEGQTFLFRAIDDGTLNGITDELTGTGTYDGTTEGVGGAGTITENAFRFRIALTSLPPGITAGTRFSSLAYANATGAGNTSEFSGVSSLTVTPVTLIAFRGQLQNGKALISWTTTDEVNNSHFEIEKSTSGSDYKTIGTVKARDGVVNQYSFTDEQATARVNYYRLKQVDTDGRPTYSKILVLRSDGQANLIKTGPNPFTTSLNIMYQLTSEETVTIRLYDSRGQQVRQYHTQGGQGANTYSISDVQTLARGTYVLELKAGTTRLKQQVIKQ